MPKTYPEAPRVWEFPSRSYATGLAPLYVLSHNTSFLHLETLHKDRVAEYFKRVPKRVVNVRGEGNSRTQESPPRLQTGLAVPSYAMQQHRDPYNAGALQNQG